MNSLVKNVFLSIMGIIVALILYYICFGATSWTGKTIDKIGSGTQATYETDGKWMGLVSYMCASVELSLSRYYFDYCYIPSVHSGDAIDLDLVRGDNTYGSATGSNIKDKVNATNKELYGLSSANITNYVLFYSSLDNTNVEGDNNLIVNTSLVNYYSTGWY
jgi:hypothetical protein